MTGNNSGAIIRAATELFFDGKDYFHEPIFFCGHAGYDTLSIEPIDGGQYEIAVRIKVGDEYQARATM